jgi:hypothetical protein
MSQQPLDEQTLDNQVQSATAVEIFTNLNFDLDSRPTQPINADDEESLSDVDVDLDELEAIPDTFIPPMLNEDGLPIPDPDSDTTDANTTTHDDDGPIIHRQSPLAETIRPLIISVQGDDTGMRVEETLFPTSNSSTRHPLVNITTTDGYRNEHGGGRVVVAPRARQLPERERRRRHRREIERRMRERRSRTVRIWGRENLNKENRKEEVMRGWVDRARGLGLRLGEVRGEWTRVMR